MYIILFVINIALWGLWTHNNYAIIIAVINIGALVIVLFQERKAFATEEHQGRSRIFFTPDVFFFLAIGVGLIGAACRRMRGDVLLLPYLFHVGFLIGGLFLLISIWVFGMRKRRGQWAGWMRSFVFVLMGVFLRLFSISIVETYQLHGSLGDRFSHITNGSSDDPVIVGDVGLVDEISDVNKLVKTPIKKEEKRDIGEQEKQRVNEGDDELVQDKKIDSTKIFALDSPGQTMTFGSLLPEVVSAYQLPNSSNTYNFTHVAKGTPLYSAFVIARDHNMIGNATHPDQEVLCKHLMVVLGLVEKWEITYTAANVFETFWEEGNTKGYTSYGCDDPNTIVRAGFLP